MLLQKSCIDVAVLLIDGFHRGDPLPPAVGTVVGSGTMIYAEGFGAEFVRAESVFLDVGFTISPMRQIRERTKSVPSALPSLEFGCCRLTCRMLLDLDCMSGGGIYAANGYESRLVTENFVPEIV